MIELEGSDKDRVRYRNTVEGGVGECRVRQDMGG